LREIAEVVARHGKSLIVDAMSSFGAIPIDAATMPFDALVAASGKCIEGPPGMGFVIARRSVLERCAGNSTSLSLDLHDQWQYMQKTTQWRYTPPTHVLVALAAALDAFASEGGQPARLARYTRNYETLVRGMAELGFRPFLDPAIQAPIIVTFHAPADSRYAFRTFYDSVREKGFILYPGKLTQVETFRVGCIGAIGPDEMRHAVNAIRDTLAELRIERVAPTAAQQRAVA
jgi:2-aminoethylphosphonate-pyruvate transaminase